MIRLQRISPLTLVTVGVIGLGVGLLLQFLQSSRGMAPFVPPLSLSFTLLVLGAVLVTLGVALRRAVTRRSTSQVNPFHAVRLLAGARAGQIVGALLAGFGAGLALQLLTRTVLPPATTWVSPVLVFAGGIVLLVCGVIAEMLCKVPPKDPDSEGEHTQSEPEPDPA